MGPEVDASAKATALAVHAQSVSNSQSLFLSVFWGHPSVSLLKVAFGECQREADKAEDQMAAVFVGEGTQEEDQVWE